MKIELYTVPGCIQADRIRSFLQKNNLPFNEIVVDNEQKYSEFRKLAWRYDRVSALKITYAHHIQVMYGFDEWGLMQLLEHIKKYNPKF